MIIQRAPKVIIKTRMAAGRPQKTLLHARNKHNDRYDFVQLIQASPSLSAFVSKNKFGDLSVDFTNPSAVKSLNGAILKSFYSISSWNLPEKYLCPPIPGRADYIHHIADLLGSATGEPPRGSSIRVLDIGVGASCIYPIIGRLEYGWSFVGTDIDHVALESARKIIAENPTLTNSVQLRHQNSPSKILNGILGADEVFDVVICNPPFHGSAEEAQASSKRKWTNLGKFQTDTQGGSAPVLNFGGQSNELWCNGGEVGFLRKMIQESSSHRNSCLWYTALVSRDSNLPAVYSALERVRPSHVRTIEMSQGQKKSRIVAWTFLDEPSTMNEFRKT